MKKQAKSTSVQKKETRPGYCPKCGAYVGAFYSCSWCHSKMPHGTRLRITQFASIIAVIAGLISLSLYARIDPAPHVNIGDINQTYSNGTVTIKGEIVNIDYIVPSDESWKILIFTVEDKTGSIDVKAYTETTDELIEERNTPALGDDCTVRGSVFVRGDELYILLESTEYLTIKRPIDFTLNSTDLYALYENNTSDYIGKRVKVNGTVSWVDTDNSYFDLDNVVRIFYPEYVRKFSPNVIISVIVGDIVEVIGLIDEYYGTLEVLPGSMHDVEIISHGGVV